VETFPEIAILLLTCVGAVLLGLRQPVLIAYIAIGFAITLGLGRPTIEALCVAVALTFPSTIIIVKLPSDKRELDGLHGRADQRGLDRVRRHGHHAWPCRHPDAGAGDHRRIDRDRRLNLHDRLLASALRSAGAAAGNVRAAPPRASSTLPAVQGEESIGTSTRRHASCGARRTSSRGRRARIATGSAVLPRARLRTGPAPLRSAARRAGADRSVAARIEVTAVM
jgi:hypothetical protein